MKRNLFTLIIGILIVAVFGMLLFLFQLRQSEVAVVTTFGKATRPITEPGAHFKLPWPIQKVYKFDQRVQNFEDKLTEGITRDSFNLLTSVYVGWKITSPTNFFPKFAGSADPIAEAERIMEQRVGNAKRAIVGNHLLADFISVSETGTNFSAIEKEILATVQSQMHADSYGLEVVFLGIKKLQLPESVTQSVFERMTSERKVLADKSLYEGEARAQMIKSAADRQSAEMVYAAEGKATQIRGQGEAEAAKYLPVFQKSPELAKFIFRLNTLESSLKDKSTLIFDRNTPPFDLFGGASTNLISK